MKTEKHSPGPWRIAPHGDGIGIIDADYNRIASLAFARGTISARVTEEQRQANADILAASLEMLAALETARATIERLDARAKAPSAKGTLDVIDAALSRAMGSRS